MYLDVKDICYLLFFVVVLLVVFVYLQVCDLVIGRFIFKIFSKFSCIVTIPTFILSETKALRIKKIVNTDKYLAI